jgi:hypothetical protein
VARGDFIVMNTEGRLFGGGDEQARDLYTRRI